MDLSLSSLNSGELEDLMNKMDYLPDTSSEPFVLPYFPEIYSECDNHANPNDSEQLAAHPVVHELPDLASELPGSQGTHTSPLSSFYDEVGLVALDREPVVISLQRSSGPPTSRSHAHLLSTPAEPQPAPVFTRTVTTEVFSIKPIEPNPHLYHEEPAAASPCLALDSDFFPNKVTNSPFGPLGVGYAIEPLANNSMVVFAPNLSSRTVDTALVSDPKSLTWTLEPALDPLCLTTCLDSGPSNSNNSTEEKDVQSDRDWQPSRTDKRKSPDVDWSQMYDVQESRKQKRLAKNRKTAAKSRERKKGQWIQMESMLQYGHFPGAAKRQ